MKTEETIKNSDWLLDDKDDYTFYPIKRPQLINLYYEQRSVHWVPADISMANDRSDFDKCDDSTKTFVKGLLAFFAPADGLVGENIFENFQKDTSFWKECRYFYAEQGSMETIHGEMYSLMAQILIRDDQELKKVYNSIRTYPSIKRISEFMKKYMDPSLPLLERIIAFACIEGILFNSAFAAISWLKKRNILRGFCKANEFICRDEAIHTKFAVALYLMIVQRHDYTAVSYERASEIIKEAIETNKQFIREILLVELIGMTSESLIDYAKCTADALSYSLGHDKIYNVDNPFDWMAVISLPNKTNFFEDKVSEYAQNTESDFVFDLNAYF